MLRRALASLVLGLGGAVTGSFAQPTGAPLSPAAYLGFMPGADYRVVDWGQVTGYLEGLARESARVRLDTIGRTTLDRPMVLVTVSHPDNLARLEELQNIQRRLADPRLISGEAERDSLVRAGRLVVLVTAAIHPTEVGSAMLPLNLAYRLASATDLETRRVLRECVVLIVPAVNPDGVDLVAEWYRGSRGRPWEGTAPPFLYHHYTGHDLNRDWYAFTQVETQNVVRRVHNVWHPQILHDVHQQSPTGGRFTLPPWLDPIEPNVDPHLIAATNALGTAVAWEMHREGKRGIEVHSGYDAWSPSRAYTHYHAGVRILSETASAELATPREVAQEELAGPESRGADRRAWNRPAPWRGGRWTIGDIVAYMESGAMAVLRVAAADREAWLENFVLVGERAVAGWPEWPEAWVIPANQPAAAGVAELLRILRTAQVEVRVARSGIVAGAETFPAGSLVIDMHQPYASFVQATLQATEYPEIGVGSDGLRPEPYDVTAHNLPLLLGVRAVALDRAPAVSLEEIGEVEGSGPAYRGLSDSPSVMVGLYQPYVPSMDEGWTRWFLDRYAVPYRTLHDRDIRQGDLIEQYTAIVLPSIDPETLTEGWGEGAMPAEYTGGLGPDGGRALAAFVEDGGTLVALGLSSTYVAEELSLPLTDRLRDQPRDVFEAPGALVTLSVDTATAVGAGMPEAGAAWLEGGHAFDLPPGAAGTIIATYGARPRALSGYVTGIAILAGAAAVVELEKGDGRVVLFGIRPQYRGQSLATLPLLFNALRRRP